MPTNRQPTPSPKAQPRKANARSSTSRPGQRSPNAAKHQSGCPHKLSHRQQENLLREHFINVRRVREWRDIHTQLHTVVAEHGWHLNTTPSGYEALHKSMLAGLLGNVGCKAEADEHYTGARGIKFHRHPGANLSKKPGRWIVVAELVETTRLFGRGIANIEPQWLEDVGGHLLHRQTSDPQWDKRTAQVVAHERATLYGLQVYQGRRVNFGRLDPAEARRIFIRSALVEGLVPDDWPRKLPFLPANQKLIRQVAELEHKARRQDVLVDDELIFAFYDQQVPADVCTGVTFERWYQAELKKQPRLLMLSKDELMRHEAAGITTQAFPKVLRLGGVDCAATYLHEPGDPKDGLSVTVPLFVLNQISDDRAEWLVPGMLKEKLLALLKTLHQRPRSRLVPLPETAARFTEALTAPEAFGHGNLMDALLKLVREATQLDIKRGDIKADMLQPHHLMHLRVVDEHGRQLGAGRSLSALKADLGSKARGAFQALASLKLNATDSADKNRTEKTEQKSASSLSNKAVNATENIKYSSEKRPENTSKAADQPTDITQTKYTTWAFGELPELMEIKKGGQTLIGFPALIDHGDSVSIEVFDEPDVAATKHQAGLRRLFALHIKDALKYLEKNIPGLQQMAVAYMLVGRNPDDKGGGQGGTAEELRQHVLDLAMTRAFLLDPLPTDATSFKSRLDEGRGRLTLIANEVARLGGTILTEYAAAARKLKDSKPPANVATDVGQQLARLVGKRFLSDTPWAQLQHLPRYLKGVQARLEKYRGDPARDATKLAELKPQDQRYWRLVAERKGQVDDRMAESAYHAKYYAHELTRRHAADGVDRLSQSLFDASVDLNPHQIEAALFALANPLQEGVLLADEVGLGKTIEAALVVCQYWAERRRRLLVICPASLRKQWAQELHDKFAVPTTVVDAVSLRKQSAGDMLATLQRLVGKAVVIMSYQFRRQAGSRAACRAVGCGGHRRSAQAAQCAPRQQPHRAGAQACAARPQEAAAHRHAAAELADGAVRPVDADRRAPVRRRSCLPQAVHEQRTGLDELRERLASFAKRTLRRDVLEYIKYTERKALTQPFNPTDDEQALYERISAFLQKEDSYALPKQQRHLTALILRKLLASSSHAVLPRLVTIRERLQGLLTAGKTEDDGSQLVEQLIAEDDLEQDYLEEEASEAEENAEGLHACASRRQTGRCKRCPGRPRRHHRRDRRADRFHRCRPSAADRHQGTGAAEGAQPGLRQDGRAARATQGHHLHGIQAHSGVPAPLPLCQRPRGQVGVVQRHQHPRGLHRHLPALAGRVQRHGSRHRLAAGGSPHRADRPLPQGRRHRRGNHDRHRSGCRRCQPAVLRADHQLRPAVEPAARRAAHWPLPPLRPALRRGGHQLLEHPQPGRPACAGTAHRKIQPVLRRVRCER
jgi:hypothetical protein